MCWGLHGCIGLLAGGLFVFASYDFSEFGSKYFFFLSGKAAGYVSMPSFYLAPSAVEVSHFVQGLFHRLLHAGLFGLAVVVVLCPPVRSILVTMSAYGVYG